MRTRDALPPGLAGARLLGGPVEYHETIGSTNDEAFRRAAEGAPEGLVVVAGRQTAGRGRQGRTWWDEPGASLLFSVLLRPEIPLPQYPLLALAMAGAVADAGERAAGVSLSIKWPNDVLHAGRKLCGVLAESRAVAAGARPVLVIGAGVNVGQAEEDFPAELRGAATSLRIASGGRGIQPGRLLAAALRRFERSVGVARGGDAAALRAEAFRRLPAPGTAVVVVSGGRRVEGTIEGIAETGALLVREVGRDGVTVVSAGEIP
jgi:BirA family biotin operon repressor/biotin-[acetyl-CoA-carboxylase] ligase